MAVYTVTPQDQYDIAGLYAAFWNRAPDTTGFGFWVEKLASGVSLDEIATAFRNAPEGVAEYPLWSTNVELVTEVYANVFGRAPDTQGLLFWTGKLDSGQVTFPELVVDMCEAAMTNGSADGALFENKVEVGVYVATVAQTDNGYVCDNAFNQVTADPASVATAEAWVDANNTGATYTLTTNIDTINVTGHAVNTVNGLFAATADNGTYNTGDTINGNGLTNVALVVNAAAAQTVTADVNNVASINVNLAVSGAGDATVDMAEFDNVAQVAITQGSNLQVLELSNAQTSTTYAMNVARTSVVDILSFESDTATGTTVNLSATGAGVSASRTAASQVYANLATFDFNGTATTDVENINLATSGNNYLRLLDTADLEVLTITGSGNNTIEVGSGVATLEVDASAATGNNTIDLLDNLSVGTDTTVLGGSGTDTVRGILNAGTTAATLTDVESVGLTFGTAASYFTAVNADSLTSVSIIDSTNGAGVIVASDENVTLTALASSVATLNVASTGTTTADTVAATYVSSSKGDLTVNVGASYDDVDVGTLTVTNLTGALTVNGAGAAKYGLVEVANVTDAKATSVNLNAVTSSLDVSGAVTAVAAAEYSLSAVAGLTSDVNRIDIGKATASYAGEVLEVNLSATGLDSTGTTGSTVVTALNTIDLAASGSMVVDLVTLVSDVDGVVSFTATQAGAGDDVTIAEVNATGAAGDGVVINLSNITENGSTVSTGAGTATVALTANADTFNGGAGDVTVTTTDGADTINGGSGVDTVIMSTGQDGIEFNSFAAGKAGDVANFDVSGWVNPLDSAGNAVVAGSVVLKTAATGAAYTFNAAAGADILVLTGVIANDAALEVSLETYLTVDALTDGEDILVAYYDGYSTQLRTVDLTTVVATDVVAATAVAGGATLTGISTADLVAGNFYAS